MPPVKLTFASIILLLSTITPLISAKAANSAPLTIGYINIDWIPFSYNKDNQAHGFAIEVVEAVINQMRHEFTFERRPFATALEQLQAGSLDVFIGLALNQERREQYHYTAAPLYYDETVLIARSDERFDFNGDVSSLIGERVAIIKGAIHGPAFDNMDGIIRIDREAKMFEDRKLYQELLEDKFRFIAINARAGMAYHLNGLGLQDRLKIYDVPIANRSLYLIFSKKVPNAEQYIQRFNRIHRLFRSTDEYGALLDKYKLNRKLFTQ